MNIRCAGCGTAVQVDDRQTGRRIECPKCWKPIDVGVPREIVKRQIVTTASLAQPLVCPVCGTSNPATAHECHSCGESFSTVPTSVQGVWRDGKQLVMTKTATLPYRCVKTNGPAELLLRRKLSWHTPALFVVIFGGVLLYVILALILSKRATLQIPVCERMRKRRTRSLIAAWFVAFAGLSVMISGIVMNDYSYPDLRPMLIMGGLFFTLFGLIFCLSRASIVSAAKITDTHVWLKGVSPEYLATLPNWTYEAS